MTQVAEVWLREAKQLENIGAEEAAKAKFAEVDQLIKDEGLDREAIYK